jgi:uncharacterized protein YidB (DUF937 family)
MDIAKIGAELLKQKLGSNANLDTIISALSTLLGNGQGGIDLKSIVSKMQGNTQLLGLVTSWLSDGKNEMISAENIVKFLGDGKVAAFASALGIGKDVAANGLADVIPTMIDKASKGGNLIEGLGGVSGILGGLKSFLK